MSTKYDQAAAGGNSSFDNLNRPKDIQGDKVFETPPVADQKAKKLSGKSEKAVEHAATVHGSIGSGDIHKAS